MRTGLQFTFHAYPVHDEDLCAKWTKANPRRRLCAMYRRVIHCLHVLFILSSMDTHFTVVVAKSCTHFVVVKQLCHSGRRVERRQVLDDVYIVGQKQPVSDLFFFVAQCCYPYVHSRCQKDMKVVVALSSF